MRWRTVLEWIYPERCELCMRIGHSALCATCSDELVLLDEPVTTHISGGALDMTAAVYAFDGRAAQAVKRLKYERATALAEVMSLELKRWSERLTIPEYDRVIPVPIHWTRRNGRGFNQAEELCRAFGTGREDLRVLKRIRGTRPQVGLTRSERLKNLKGAFQASHEASGQRVLLIDDVTTTGGTGIACAEALKAVGASWVGLLAFCGEREQGKSNPS